jgi:hypothetical protein
MRLQKPGGVQKSFVGRLEMPGPFPNINSTNLIGDTLECALV